MKKSAAVLVGLCLMTLSPGARGQKAIPGQTAPPVASAPASGNVVTNLDFGRVPLYFIPNQGQLDKRVAYYIQGQDKSIYFTPGGVTMALTRPETTAAQASVAKSWVVKLDFVGANKKVRPVGEDATGGVVSYFKGRPKDWKAGLPAYSRIVYRDLWPGIDLAYSGTMNRLKYEFIVQPGADPAQVRLAYRGVDGISVDDDGRLEVGTPAGRFKDDTPVAWQEIDGVRKDVSLSYKLDAQAENEAASAPDKKAAGSARGYGFEIGAYDPARTLVLDPSVVVFAGFIGGVNEDYGRGVAVDSQGYIYVTGYTSSTVAQSFPVMVGPDLTDNGSYDAFVAKVDATGAALLYCGYIGGANDDRAYGVGVDASGNAYVTGYTLSDQTTFPVVPGSYDQAHNGLKDAFIAKVNAGGTALTYCTYIGGAGDDVANCIAVDASGNAYIGGSTASSEATFCEFTGPDLSFNGGNNDAFVCKLNAAGNGRVFCGYIGGDWDEAVNGIDVDGSGNVYAAGNTGSREGTFPVWVGPYLTTVEATNGFVAKINASGIGLAYCGFLGCNSADSAYAVAVDARGSAHFTGSVHEPGGLPVLVGPDLTHNGWNDAFVAKVKPDGTGYLYCGYIGGTGIEAGYAIAVDSAGNAYVTGETDAYGSVPYPLVDAFDTTTAGNSEGFIAKISPSGAKMTYSSYIGGGGEDISYGAAPDARGNVYLVGYTTYGADFPYAVGPDLTTSGTDAFVAKIYNYFVPGPKTTVVGDFDGDGTKELAVDLGTSGAWMYDGGSWTQLSAMNPQGMITANVDADPAGELLLEFGYSGLWLYDNGALNLLSEEDVQTMAAGDVDADGSDEVAVDFGTVGFWLFKAGSWTQLSGANLDTMVIANLDGSGGAEILGDFGPIGLWELSGGSWTQLSGVNVENMASGNTEGSGGAEILGDFGPVGLWLLGSGNWTQLSNVNADYMITADLDHSGADELVGDFSGIGLWLYDDAAGWEILSGLDSEWEVAADTDGDAAKEMAVDFGPLGIWHYDGGSWTQISGVDPENMIAGDLDGDSAEEIVADFGTVGLWLWNGGVWSQISANNPD